MVERKAAGSFSLSALQRRILQFFRGHPHAVETARGIATWVGVEVESVGSALKELLEWKWLIADETDAVTGYALTRDERLLTQVLDVLGER